MANNQMTNYIMPTAEDVPPIHVFFEEIPFRYGGFGAKGIGELPHDGPAPAILNAIRDATGVGFHAIPLLPEDLYAGLAAINRPRSRRCDERESERNWQVEDERTLAGDPIHGEWRKRRCMCRR